MRSKSLSRCATLLFASFFAVLIFLAGSGAQAQVASKADRASAESLTQSLIALHTQYRATPAEGRAALIGQLRALAAERQQFLKNADRWKSMKPEERQAWRNIVENAELMPPDGFGSLMPPPPRHQGKSNLANGSNTAEK